MSDERWNEEEVKVSLGRWEVEHFAGKLSDKDWEKICYNLVYQDPVPTSFRDLAKDVAWAFQTGVMIDKP